MMPRSPKQEAPSVSPNHGSTGDEAMDKSKLPATEGTAKVLQVAQSRSQVRKAVPRILKYMYQRNCSQRASDE